MISNIKVNKLKGEFYNYTCGYEDDELTFELHNNERNDVEPALPNAIRRIIEEKVNAYNIDIETINIHSNISIVNNDIIVQRLKMLPYIFAEASKYDLDKLEIKLNIKNEGHSPIDVYSKDFKFYYDGKEVRNFISYSEILFMEMVRPEYEISLDYKLKLSNTKNDDVSFRHCSKNVFINKPDEEELKKKLDEIKDEKLKRRFEIENKEIIFKVNKYSDPMDYLYSIHSNGVMSSVDTLKMGINELIENIKYFSDNLENPDYMLLEINKDNPKMTTMYILNETHTLGNLLSCYFTKHKDLDVSSYRVPHPLEIKLNINLIFNSEKDNTLINAERIVKEQCTFLIEILTSILKNF